MGLLLKIAVFAVAAYTVWTAVTRWYGILGGKRPGQQPDQRPGQQPDRQPRGPAQAPTAPRVAVEETRLCPACGAYVALSAAKCGRADCPLPA